MGIRAIFFMNEGYSTSRLGRDVLIDYHDTLMRMFDFYIAGNVGMLNAEVNRFKDISDKITNMMLENVRRRTSKKSN